MKIRITGNREELAEAVERLKEVFEIKNISKPYDNRNSTDCRIYVEVENKKV